MKSPHGSIEPPRLLGEHGLDLWHRVQDEFHIEDPAGVEFLTQACQACDLAEALHARIEDDGVTLRTAANGVRSHPAIKDELQARALVIRTLARLGITEEPIRPVRGPGQAAGRGPTRRTMMPTKRIPLHRERRGRIT